MKFLFLTIVTLGLYPIFRLLKAFVGVFSRSTHEKTSTTAQPSDQACPYCGAIQDPPPQRKRKCRDCGEPIYVRKLRDGCRELLTEGEVKKIERKERDAHWKELSKQVENALRERDWKAASQAYFGQAHVLFAEGRNHHGALTEACRCELLGMQELGIRKVKVSTAEDERVCQTCRKLDGKVLNIDFALEKMPIPSRTCDDRRDRNQHGGFCRSSYTAVFK